ncbi:MAG: exosome complex RNA-binding protein Csl4 [Thermoplasmata archaeon]|nr:exosome complex RNA-binding protein Csl4 [Thermoplasmata archaeon]
MNEKMAMPGDELATSEEYMPGQGTYESNGTIFAAVMGKPVFNESEKTVQVLEIKIVSALKPGDIILGEVSNVSNSLANVIVSGVEDSVKRVGFNEMGVIHVSKITEAYTDDARKEYRTGDLVRARVLQARPSLQLSSKEPELGVLKARCSRCRIQMVNKSGKLYCNECENNEHRKLASDFGKFTPGYTEA